MQACLLTDRARSYYPWVWLCLALALPAAGAPKPRSAAPEARSAPRSEAPARGAAPAKAAESQPQAPLDQNRVHFIYNEGEFDQVVSILEEFTRTHKSYGVEDSIFIAKHLAVIYTANIATREKGKRYMFQLLDLAPAARIVDMFVSDEIDRVFQKVKEEFEERQKILGKGRPSQWESNRYAVERLKVAEDSASDGPGKGRQEERPARTKRKESSGTAYWLAGGAVAVAAAAGTAYYLMQPGKGEDKYYELP